jgi:5-methylcytosine-specific restriction protein B
MSRYNPNRQVVPIYEAAERWRRDCLEGEGSVLVQGKALWTAERLGELDRHFVQNLDAGEGTFLQKLEAQLASSSPAARQLMAELLWVLLLFPSNIGASKKRETVREVWAWSDEALPEDHPMLADAVLDGIGSGGTAFNTQRWRELVLLITAVRDLKGRGSDDRRALLSDPWTFSKWFADRPEAPGRQLRHMLPHLLFPDTFERISSQGDKERILSALADTTAKEVKRWPLDRIDRELLSLRERLEQGQGGPIDFYADELRPKWHEPKLQPPVPTAPAADDKAVSNEASAPPAPALADAPLNLILYGPPGTGKTHRLMRDHVPRYRGPDGDRFAFVAFHQGYAYEDFVEGIRPAVVEGAVSYEVRPGVLRRLCERARRDPGRRYALLVDEINRGNVAKVFGELISLIEVDKRIRTDGAGARLEGCTGLEVTLPYSGERFGVPANLDVIATMNTADRSIALLDSALRRRFRFKELLPEPERLGEIDDGEGGTIDLAELLATLNARLAHLLHRDRTLGHSYLMAVRTFDDLRRVLSQEILPLLQDAFYDDWGRIRLVLADTSADAEFQIVRARAADTDELFAGADAAEVGEAELFEVVSEREITPDAVRKVYETPG